MSLTSPKTHAGPSTPKKQIRNTSPSLVDKKYNRNRSETSTSVEINKEATISVELINKKDKIRKGKKEKKYQIHSSIVFGVML
jgi:hypothetical protein